MANDVRQARHKMNFSDWGAYPENKRDHELEGVCNEILSGEMPDGKYAWIHRASRLTEDERGTIYQWTGSPHDRP